MRNRRKIKQCFVPDLYIYVFQFFRVTMILIRVGHGSVRVQGISMSEPMNNGRVGFVRFLPFFGSQPEANQPVYIRVGSGRLSGLLIKTQKLKMRKIGKQGESEEGISWKYREWIKKKKWKKRKTTRMETRSSSVSSEYRAHKKKVSRPRQQRQSSRRKKSSAMVVEEGTHLQAGWKEEWEKHKRRRLLFTERLGLQTSQMLVSAVRGRRRNDGRNLQRKAGSRRRGGIDHCSEVWCVGRRLKSEKMGKGRRCCHRRGHSRTVREVAAAGWRCLRLTVVQKEGTRRSAAVAQDERSKGGEKWRKP